MAATGAILVVDDDPAICVVVGEALRRQGHKVKTAASIRERTALMDSFAPDVLLTDVMLPDGDGLDGVADVRVTVHAHLGHRLASELRDEGVFDDLLRGACGRPVAGAGEVR